MSHCQGLKEMCLIGLVKYGLNLVYVFACCFVLPVLLLSALLLPLPLLLVFLPSCSFCSPLPIADEIHLLCIYLQSTQSILLIQ